jgi:hypothetical protein
LSEVWLLNFLRWMTKDHNWPQLITIDHNEAADVYVFYALWLRFQVCFWAGSLPLSQSKWEDIAKATLCGARYDGPHVPCPRDIPWWFECIMWAPFAWRNLKKKHQKTGGVVTFLVFPHVSTCFHCFWC